MKTILVAACPAAADVLVGALDGVGNAIVAHTIEAATDIIEQGVDLIIAGVYFDGARMFDLLRHVSLRAGSAPVLCVRAVGAPAVIGAVTPQPTIGSFEVVERASRALGAVGFIDLAQRLAVVGAEAAQVEFGWRVREELNP